MSTTNLHPALLVIAIFIAVLSIAPWVFFLVIRSAIEAHSVLCGSVC